MRIIEGQLQGKYLSSLLSTNFKPNKLAPKYNLAVKVITESAKLGLNIKELAEDQFALNIRGLEITNLLNKKKIHFFIELDQLNLFTLEQLIDSSEYSLLT